jgi:hypothetical protein
VTGWEARCLSLAARECQLLLDEQRLCQGSPDFHLGSIQPSSDDRLLAYSSSADDAQAAEALDSYTLHIMDTATMGPAAQLRCSCKPSGALAWKPQGRGRGQVLLFTAEQRSCLCEAHQSAAGAWQARLAWQEPHLLALGLQQHQLGVLLHAYWANGKGRAVYHLRRGSGAAPAPAAAAPADDAAAAAASSGPPAAPGIVQMLQAAAGAAGASVASSVNAAAHRPRPPGWAAPPCACCPRAGPLPPPRTASLQRPACHARRPPAQAAERAGGAAAGGRRWWSCRARPTAPPPPGGGTPSSRRGRPSSPMARSMWQRHQQKQEK